MALERCSFMAATASSPSPDLQASTILRCSFWTRLREAGMALEAVQAQAGHASIESTRIYLHLADDWLASQYRRAAEVIDAQVYAGPTTASPRPLDPDPLDRVPVAGFRRLR